MASQRPGGWAGLGRDCPGRSRGHEERRLEAGPSGEVLGAARLRPRREPLPAPGRDLKPPPRHRLGVGKGCTTAVPVQSPGLTVSEGFFDSEETHSA